MRGSADKTLDLLEAIADQAEAVGLLELAQAADLDKSTASRHLAGLVERGYVRRDERTRKFSIGDRLLALATTSLQHSTLRSAARAHLESLRDQSGETASLALRVGIERVCIAGAESHHDIRRVVRLGERVPLYEGAGGEAILSVLPPNEVRSVLQSAERAGADLRRLRSGIRRAKETGYAWGIGLRAAGVSTVAVPVSSTSAGPTGAILLAGPDARLTEERIHALAPALLEAASDLSQTTHRW